MNNISPKMAAAFGMGFIGFILAAYSYNQEHKNEYKDALPELLIKEPAKDIKKEDTKNNDSKIKTDVKSFIDEIKSNNNWGQFWKDEYKNMRFKEEE